MSHITLVLPHLLPLPEFAPDLVRALQAPALACLLTRTSAHERSTRTDSAQALPHEQWLARTLGLSADGRPAFAAAAMRGFGLDPLDGTWFIVNPAHIQIARSHSMMADLRHLGLRDDESRSLYEAARPLCEDIQHPLLYGDAQTWFLRADDWTGIDSATPDTVAGMDLTDFVPRGKQAMPLRRLQNEVQMLWHTHPVNAAREARRLPAVNSFWLWGAAARAPQPGARVTSAAATDPLPPNPWEKWGWAFAAIWLVFLAYPVIAVAESDAPVPAKVASLLCIAGFAVANVLAYSPRNNTWVFLGLMIALGLATVPVIGVSAVSYTPYLAILSALELPSPAWKWAVAAWVVLPLLSLLGIDGFPSYIFLMLWPIMLGGVMLRIFGEREEVAHEAQRQFALATERERVARDVHDVLGHSLTALSVKAELAARLVDVDPVRAKAELESIQATARQALAEVRATVGGLRAGNLEAELAAAPLVLADAGIATTVTGDVADTDPRHRALLAWVLRESVTNVVRHARAGSVVIELGPRGICVTDDGAGCSGGEGNGLRGMRERVGGAGGTLAISPASPGTRVEVALP